MDALGTVLTVMLILVIVALALILVQRYRIEKLEGEVKRLTGLIANVLKASGALEALSQKAQYRPRKRYIIFRLLSEKPMPPSRVEGLIRRQVRDLYGDYGIAESRLHLVYYNPGTGYGVVRTTQMWKDKLIVALSLLRSMDGSRILVIPVRVTGSIKRAREIIREHT